MKTDVELQRDILEEIAWEPSASAKKIEVTVLGGIVTLTGNADNLPGKWGAEKAALRVSGVMAVANEIDVRLPTGSHRSDEEIARAASEALEWNTLLPKNIQVMVKDGWITLTGRVQWQFQRKAAEEALKRLTGVIGVTNQLAIQTRSTAFAIKGKIEAALRRHAALDWKKIQVKIVDGKVTLEGTVGSWAEKQDAEAVAWSAPGVTEVDNKLSIQIRKS